MVSLKGCIVALWVVHTLVLHADAARAGAGNAAPGGAAGAGGNLYCATAFDKVVCEKLTKTAENWNQAMSMVLAEATKHADLVIKHSKSEQLGGTGCAETYTNIHARLKECSDLVSKADRRDEINFKLSASVTSLEDCKDKLQDIRDDETPFYAFNRHFDHVLKICLAVDKSRHVEKVKVE